MLVVILDLFCGFDCTVADSVLLFAVGCVRLGVWVSWFVISCEVACGHCMLFGLIDLVWFGVRCLFWFMVSQI